MEYLVFGVVLIVATTGCYYAPTKEMISTTGLWSGLVAGLLFVPLPLAELSASWRDRIAIAVMTVVAVVLMYAGLELVLPDNEAAYNEVYSFIQYFLCGFIFNALPVYLLKYFSPHAIPKNSHN